MRPSLSKYLPDGLPDIRTLLACLLLFASLVLYGMIFSLKVKVGVALFVAAVFVTVISFSLDIGLIIAFFLIPFDRLGKLNPESSITFAKVFIGLLILVWLVRVLAKRDDTPVLIFARNPVLILTFLSLTFAVVSIMNARNQDLFFLHIIRRVNVTLLVILIMCIVRRKETLVRILAALLVSFFFFGLTGIFEMATGDSILKTYWGEDVTKSEFILKTGESRVEGPSGDPDFHAIMTIFPTLISVTFLFLFRSKLVRGLSLLMILLMFVNLLGTGSRGGMLALAVGGFTFWLFSRMRWKYFTAGLTVLLTLVIFVTFSLVSPNAPTERYTGELGGKSILFRVGWAEMAVAMIEDHPIVGIGTGNYVSEYNRYIRVTSQVPRSPYWTHNSYLQMWSENGIFALLVFITIMAVCAWRMFLVVRATGDPSLRCLSLLLLSTVVAYAAFAGSSNIIENEFYWTVFAFSVTVHNLFQHEMSPDPAPAVPQMS